MLHRPLSWVVQHTFLNELIMKWIIPVVLAVFFAACHTNAPRHQATPEVTSTEARVVTAAEPAEASVNVSVSEFEKLIGKKNTLLLDVRTPEETAAGKIAGAMEIDVLAADFTERVRRLDKDKTYLVYCRSGRRSTRAVEIMATEGFSHLINLEGGFNAWTAEHQ